MPPKAAAAKSAASSAKGPRQPGSSGTLARGGAAVLSSGPADKKADGKSKAPADKKADGKAKADAELLEIFEKYEPEGKADGKLKIQQFAQIIRDMNVKKMMIWGDEPQPIVKQEWTKVGGFTKKELDFADFKAWWPTFLEMVEKTIAEQKAEEEAKEQKEAAAKKAKADRCSGDGVWKIPLNDLEYAVEKAREKGKTALIIDNTENQRVETYYTYRSCYVIECKKWIMEKATKKATVEEILKAEQQRFFSAKCFKHGQTVMFRLATSACDLKNTFSNEAFPSMALLDCPALEKVRGIENADNFKGSPFEKMCPDSESLLEHTSMGVHKDFNVIVITLFKEADYEGYLKDMIPLDLLQPIMPEVD